MQNRALGTFIQYQTFRASSDYNYIHCIIQIPLMEALSLPYELSITL